MSATVTVMDVMNRAASRSPDVPALKTKVGGEWVTITWGEYRRRVRLAARGMMALGLEPGKAVAIIGYNRPEWFIADVGAIHAGGVPAGIYTTCSAEQCHYIAEHSEAAVAVVENREQLDKFLAVRERLPELKAIVLMEGSADEDGVYAWDELLRQGEEGPDEEALEQRIAAQKPDDLCTLIYTSGTTGPPKAVMMTHRNFVWTAQALWDQVPQFAPGDAVVSYLPLSHVAEQLISIHLQMAYAGCCYCLQNLELLGDTLREARPALFLGVPRVWEKIQAKIETAGAENSGLKKAIARWARKKGLAGGFAEQQGQSRPFAYGLADKLVFSKVREKLGLDRCRVAVTSTAPIARSTLEFFLSLGLPICEVYGMSECAGPTTMCTPARYRTGKAGFAIPGTELKIAEDGEILIRGPHVMPGYYKNEEATAETIDAEGWLHSGDIGTLDEDGFLQVTDRKKELIITAGGKNISPQLIEATLKSIPAVAQAVVIGDRRKFLSALLTLDAERVVKVAEEAGISGVRDVASALTSPAFRQHLEQEIQRVSGVFSRVERVKKFTLLPEELTVEGGELTPTMKLKRRVINDKYADQIEGMYN